MRMRMSTLILICAVYEWCYRRERWVLMKIPRCDTDGVGKVK